MSMKKIFLTILFLSLQAQGVAEPDEKLLGTWISEALPKEKWMINADGSVEYQSEFPVHHVNSTYNCQIVAQGEFTAFAEVFDFGKKDKSENEFMVQVNFMEFKETPANCGHHKFTKGVHDLSFKTKAESVRLRIKRDLKSNRNLRHGLAKDYQEISFVPEKMLGMEEAFLRAAVFHLHDELKNSIQLTDYYMACLTKDWEWFKKQAKGILSTPLFCGNKLAVIRDKIKARYTLMKALLGLGQYPLIGDAGPPLTMAKAPGSDYGNLKLRVYQNVQHEFDNLITLNSLSKEETELAAKILKTDLEERYLYIHKKDPETQEKTYCAKASELAYIRMGDSCYRDAAYELIFGNKEKGITPLPILAFVTSENPDDEMLFKAAGKIRANALAALNELKTKYVLLFNNLHPSSPLDARWEKNFFLLNFEGTLKRMVAENPLYQLAFENFKLRFEEYNTNKMYFELGGMISWGIGCSIFVKGLLARGLCELPIGLGANMYFYLIDSDNYQTALQNALVSPNENNNPETSLKHIDDLALSRDLSLYALPFFTGVPHLFKALLLKYR